MRASGLFDLDWYLDHNPDVTQPGVDPLLQFVRFGGQEGRDPGPNFSSRGYLESNEDVKSAGINPLVHYLKYGRQEGREKGGEVHSFELSRMYDYSSRAGRIIFEDSPEQVRIPRPAITGSFSGELEAGEAILPRPYVSVIKDAVIFGGSNFVVAPEGKILSD